MSFDICANGLHDLYSCHHYSKHVGHAFTHLLLVVFPFTVLSFGCFIHVLIPWTEHLNTCFRVLTVVLYRGVTYASYIQSAVLLLPRLRTKRQRSFSFALKCAGQANSASWRDI